MLTRSASLAMSTSVLKALKGKLNIKRHSPCILYIMILGIQCEVLDVTNTAAVEAFAAKIEKVDILFNCAG